MTPKISKSWWLTDAYDVADEVPAEFSTYGGPKGFALVKAWADGTTTQGWGLQGKNGAEGFWPRYKRDEFNPRRTLYGYTQGKWAFAFVMRSLSLIAIDIDGKNGGIDHANELLGNAGPTLAETSKSGNGYHLFYSTDEVWEQDTGFGAYSDSIGIVQGVDIRAVGCIYHHPQQRWNDRKIAPLPKHIADTLKAKAALRAVAQSRVGAILELDETEKLMLHDELITDLNKPIPAGKRNNTLFAIGAKMEQAQVPGWEALVQDRAGQVGMGQAEADKIISNIVAYAPKP